MSIAASAWAKRQTTGSATRKAVLMVLADYASSIEELEPPGADGRHYAWPGRARLVEQTEMSERSLVRCIADLEDQGLLRSVRRHDRDGHRMSDVVILAVDDDGDRPFETAEVSDWHVGAKVPTATGQGANGDSDTYIRTTKEPRTKGRATRIPDDFQVTEEMRAWYREKIAGAIDGQREHEKFVAHFQSASGTNARKVSWSMAWKKWMLTALDRAPRRPTSGAPAGAAQAPRYPSAAEREQARRDQEHREILAAEAYVEAHGGSAEDHKAVFAVVARIRSGELPLADRTVMPYIEGEIVRNDGATKEVTSHASE